MGVGGPAGFNVAHAAKAAGYRVLGFDSSPDMLPMADMVCAETFVMDDVPVGLGDIRYAPILCQPEEPLLKLANLRDEGIVNWHGPSERVLQTTKNKTTTAYAFHGAGLRDKKPVPIGPEIPDHLHLAQDAFGGTFWLRAYTGAGAKSAILVSDLREAYHWIRLHEVRFGMYGAFVAEEYLPGRDFCWTGLYHEGELIASFARERLNWIYPRLAPFSGRTGTPTRAKVVHDYRVNGVGRAAVAIVDPKPHGVYCVDMRENKGDDWPCPTEINAGRWATTSPIYSHFGPNLVAAQIRLANNDSQDVLGEDVYPDGLDLLRHIDMGSAFCLTPLV
jgi:carbamoyl-phosphate synthase large subunit